MWLQLYGALLLVWPVPDPVVERAFEPPPQRWAAGHRGVDLAVAPGQGVRAVGAGEVTFAGIIAGKGVVSVRLSDSGYPPLRVSYEPVRALVEAGDRVAAGQTVGHLTTRPRHCRASTRSCLHLGVRRGERYLDPMGLLRPHRPVLLPLERRSPPHVPGGGGGASERAGTTDETGAATTRDMSGQGQARDSGQGQRQDWDLTAGSDGQNPTTATGLAAACALAAASLWARSRLRRARGAGRAPGRARALRKPARQRRAAPCPPLPR